MASVHTIYPFLVNKTPVFFIFTSFPIICVLISTSPLLIFQASNGQSLNTTNESNWRLISNIFDLRYSLLVNFTSKIDQIYGHLNASVINKIDGNETLAVAHAGHPIA